MNFETGIFMNLMDHETYLMTHEMQLFGNMSCVKDSSIIHRKLMALNHGNEINNCKINDHGKRFMGFS